MSGPFTRRRVAAALAAGAGLLSGFPAAAVSCASRRFGEFEVSAYKIGVLIRHTKRYGKVALDAFLMADGSGRMSIALYTTGAIPDGTLLDVLYRFNDGTVIPTTATKNLTYTQGAAPHHVLQTRTEPNGRLFAMFRKARTVTIEVRQRTSGETLAIGRNVSLTGSSKAARHARSILTSCTDARNRAPRAGTGSPPPAGCFLTTACVEMLGLRDDCFELRTLRAFRDGDMCRDARGRALIQAYRDLAPAILHAMPLADRPRILRALYGRYILPSVLAIRLGLPGVARRIYIAGMLACMRRYTPDLLAEREAELSAVLAGGRRV